MAEIPRPPSREEREFWDRQFDDDDRAGRRDPARDPARDLSDVPRRSGPRAPQPARLPEGVLTRVVDRVRGWRGDARLGVVVLVLVAVVAGFVWYRIGVGGTSAGAATSAGRAVTTTSASATTTTRAFADTNSGTGATSGTTASATNKAGGSAMIAVHVAGAVTRPGVVELPPGSRVIDAVEAVGGAVAGGDLDRLNLAAKVADGQRVYVARVGQADPGVAGDTSGALGVDGSAAGTGTGTGPAAKVNLNTATQAQIEELPGIGPTYAQAIIAERQRRGGFKSVNELRSVRGIGDKRFTELAPLVTV